MTSDLDCASLRKTTGDNSRCLHFARFAAVLITVILKGNGKTNGTELNKSRSIKCGVGALETGCLVVTTVIDKNEPYPPLPSNKLQFMSLQGLMLTLFATTNLI